MNKRIISKAGLLGLTGWAAVAALSVIILRRPPINAPTSPPNMEVAQGVFPREQGERRVRNGVVPEEEWKAAKEFLRIHSPNRFKVIETIPSGEPREGLKRFLVNHYRSIAELKNKSPELYDTRLREVKLEDDIFGLCQVIKHKGGGTPEIQTELKAKVTDLFNLGLTERKQRISLVETSLVEQKKTLEADERDKDKLAKQQYEYVMVHGVEGARLDVSAAHHSGAKSKTSTTSPGETEPDAPENPEP